MQGLKENVDLAGRICTKILSFFKANQEGDLDVLEKMYGHLEEVEGLIYADFGRAAEGYDGEAVSDRVLGLSL